MKKMFSKMSALLMMATFSIFMFAAAASAAPIVGTIDFEGSLQLTDGSFDPAESFAVAKGMQFSDVTVKFATDDFAGLNNASAKYEDFVFDSFVVPVVPLWTVNSFSFTLETLDIVLHTANFLLLKGFGLLKADGYDDTRGAWLLSSQSSDGSTGVTFSATSSAAPVAVPEPGTLLLLGSGMAGLALARRRTMSK